MFVCGGWGGGGGVGVCLCVYICKDGNRLGTQSPFCCVSGQGVPLSLELSLVVRLVSSDLGTRLPAPFPALSLNLLTFAGVPGGLNPGPLLTQTQ